MYVEAADLSAIECKLSALGHPTAVLCVVMSSR
jgi:hypothetical protein